MTKLATTTKFCDFDGDLKLPAVVEIEPTNYCNLRCRMCHVSYQERGERHHIELEPLKKLRFPKDALIVLGSSYEPMMHPEFVEMMSIFRDFGVKLDIITNGTLLTDRIIEAMAEVDFNKIGFSFDGIRKETYESIRRGADYDRTIDNILKTRKAFEDRDTFFSINSVLMRSNIDELIEAIDFWDDADFDQLGFVFMISRSKDEWVLQQSLFDVRDYAYGKLDDAAKHLIEHRKRLMVGCPYYSRSPIRHVYPNNFRSGLIFAARTPDERFPKLKKVPLQWGTFRGMKFKGCRSAFVFARILSNGDVQLCLNHVIGNINSEPFEDIWFGEKACEYRRKLMATTEICESCTYWLFCLNQHNLNTDDSSNYLGGEFRQRSLVEEGYKGCNILKVAEKFYGLAQSEGRLDLDKVDTEGYRCVAGDSVDEVKRLIGELSLPEQSRTLIEEGYKGCNILKVAEKFYGLAQSEGGLDLDKIDAEGYRCVVGDSVDEVKRLIDGLSLPEQSRTLTEEGYRGYNIISIGNRLYGLAQEEGKLELEKVGAEGYRCVVGESVAEVKRSVDRQCTSD